jgi:hypothetical protein
MRRALFRLCVATLSGVALFPQAARGQESGAPLTPAQPQAERPGLIRAGSIYLTPYVGIGSLGLDTNVFYTPTDRQTDFLASGGPGLYIVRPFDAKAQSRLSLDGALDYLYYAKTESQRRLNGHGSALLDLHGVRTDVVVEERYAQSYSRPNYQVYDRVQQETEGTRGLLKRRLADRLQLALFGERQRTRTESQIYLGTDLRLTASEDHYETGGELRTALSVKTQFAVGGEQNWHRFPYAPERDGESVAAFGGFRTDSSALLAGHALAGIRWLKLDSGGRRDAFYADVDVSWSLSPKTTLRARYSRDLQYSVFATSGATPTNVYEIAEVYLDKMLARSIYLVLYGRFGGLLSDGAITVDTADGPVVSVRDDSAWEAGAELGYQFRTRVRVGGTLRYTKRYSNIETFGIDGLIAGLTVTYNPPRPQFR